MFKRLSKRFKGKRGSILVASYLVLAVLLILGTLFFSRIVSDRKLMDISRERLEAFYLAEAGVDRTIRELDDNFNYSGSGAPVALGRGEYETVVTVLSSTRRSIDARGYIPSKADARAQRRIEAIIRKQTPPNFYDYAIYSSHDIDFNGTSYSVTGDIIYANSVDNSGNVNGTVTQDANVSPLAQFDFMVLRAIAVSQGNLYDAARLSQVQKNKDSYPSSFWFSAPTDPADPATGTPNVVYVEGDMVLNGDIGTIGGFFLVVGNVLTDPEDTSDTTINGNGQVAGCIYTTGKFRVNGGGGNLNVDGGVWSGTDSDLNGNATISYNGFFMDAVESMINGLGASGVAQMISWREIE
ncbi:MAG: hypothetical protein WC732_02365 [Candidatus Omnitrophota bacterium]